MSVKYRRQVLRQATGPTEAEFAASGATLLVGFISPRYPDRLANHIRLSPVDQDYTRFQYLDALPALVGTTIGALFRKSVSPETRMAATQTRVAKRTERKEARQENRTQSAANALLRWFESEGGDVDTLWSSPGNGAGFFFTAEDTFTVLRLQDQAKKIARDPRHSSYYAVFPSAYPGKFLVVFVREPRLVPIDYQSAVELALESTSPSTTTHDEIDEYISFDPNVKATDLTPASPVEAVETEEGTVEIDPVPGVFPPRSAGWGGIEDNYPIPVGNIGDFFKKTFGPKKPEGIQKKIEKLESQLAYWKGKLAETEASTEGVVLGNVYGGMGSMASSMFGRASSAKSYARSYSPEMFDEGELDDADYGDLEDPGMFEEGSAQDYGAADEVPEMFEAAMGLEDLGITREQALAVIKAEYKEALQAGEIGHQEHAALIKALPDLSDDELADELEAVLGEDEEGDEEDEAGRFGPMRGSSARPLGGGSFGGRRGGRGRRRRRRRNRRARRAMRRARRGGGGGGGGGSPSVVVIREDGGGDDYDDYDDYDDESDGIEDDEDGAAGVAGPRDPGRVFDQPRSPNGWNTTYPTG